MRGCTWRRRSTRPPGRFLSARTRCACRPSKSREPRMSLSRRGRRRRSSVELLDRLEPLQLRIRLEVLELVELADLDLGFAVIGGAIRKAPRPLERLLARLRLDQRVAGDEL